MKYAVRCCCQPRKVFGWLELPAGLRDGQRLPVWPRLSALDHHVDEVVAPVPIETILMRSFSRAGAAGEDGRLTWSTELAVYSEDRPEEFWRALPNFTPASDGNSGHEFPSPDLGPMPKGTRCG